MTALFLKLFNMGLTAGWLVLAVLVVRLLFQKAPRWILCLLWGIVALRLLMPFSVESGLSLIPSAEIVPQDIGLSQAPAIHSGIPSLNEAVNPVLTQQIIHHQNPMLEILHWASVLWAVGVAVMVLYGVVSYLVLRWRVRVSVLDGERVYLCDDIQSAFILGVLRPRIYIPSGMQEDHLRHVLAHENAHIRRHDHWWKPLGFCLLCVYWFHPLLWLAYVLLCRDIERACDEKVVAGMDSAGKRDYSEALLASSLHRRMILSCPVAFGEVSVKGRIKSVLSYKKPAFWIVLASVAVCAVTAVCFLTNPRPCIHLYHSRITEEATCTQKGMQTLTCKRCQYSCCAPTEMLDHSYDAGVVTEAPDCLRTGVLLRTCTDCGGEKTEKLPLTGHTTGEMVATKKPNCTQQGEVHSKCRVCDVVFVSEILPTDDTHDLAERVIRESTCSTPGEGIRECTRCDYSESCSYERTAHQLRQVTEGSNVLVKCKVCNGVMQSTPVFISKRWD